VTGLDCSCLIARAAQIYGIPYFFKNTTTLFQCMKPIEKGQSLQNGDLMWYMGHVLVVSDVKNNKITESVGYPFGYGKVIEHPLHKVFKDMYSYSDLEKACFNGQPIQRLSSDGHVARTVNKVLFYSMKKSWDI
jgi:hypothetical protein